MSATAAGSSRSSAPNRAGQRVPAAPVTGRRLDGTIGRVTWLFIPLVILAGLLLLVGLVVFLGRFRNGRYLRPIILALSRSRG